MRGDEPVGSTGGGRHAPTMDSNPARREFAESHFCDAVGSTVYAPVESCPYCSSDDENDDENEVDDVE